MNIAGITAEYNPFHTGHAYQISALKAQLGPDTSVVAVMSGSWVQQGRPAVTDKWTRARMALNGGADLILELPTVWAAASAESFARGAVELLCRCGVIDTLCFGSETGELVPLLAAADCLDSPDYPEQLRRALEGGASFAAARQAAVEAPHRSGGGRPGQPQQQFGSGVSPRPALAGQQHQAPSPSAGRGRPTTAWNNGGGLPLRHPAAAAPGTGGVGGRPALCPRRESGPFTVRPPADPELGERAMLACLRKMSGGGLGQTARRRSRGGPAPAIRAGGAAVSEPGRLLCPGQDPALCHGPVAADGPVGLSGPDGGGRPR